MTSVLITVLMPSITPEEYKTLLPKPSPELALSDCIGNLWQIGGLVACILAAASIPAEAERGTIELVLSRPVRPWEVIVSKYLSVVAIISIAVQTSALSTWAYSHVLGKYPLASVTFAAIHVTIALTVVAAFSIVAGTLFKSQIAAVTCSIIVNLAVALSKTVIQHHTTLYQAHPFISRRHGKWVGFRHFNVAF